MPAEGVQILGQVRSGSQCPLVTWAEDSFAAAEGIAVQLKGPLMIAVGAQLPCQVVGDRQTVRMARSQDTAAPLVGVLVQIAGSCVFAQLVEAYRKVARGRQGQRVVDA